MNGKFKLKIKKPLRKATLCFLVKGDKILLAMKKRGFGKGLYNGVGGKQDKGESIVETAIRETFEEIGVEIINPIKQATLNFYFPHIPLKEDWNQQVVVFVADKWKGRPKESDEMKPMWFNKINLPYNKMWADDSLWLPHVMQGKRVTADFYFDKNQNIEYYKLKIN
jgi:8-oxo-dGTP pyrophosphatase MutT (NUDIX family)